MRALAITVLLAGCSALPPPSTPAPAATARERGRLLAIPDETMVFTVALRGVTLARVQTAVGHLGEIAGHRAVIARSRGHTEGILSIAGDLTWELTTTLDLDTGKALEAVEESWATFQGEHAHERSTHGNDREDLHTAITLLRAWRPTAAERREVDVEIGGGRFRVEVWLGARVKLRMPALRFDGIAADQFPFSIWISDDADRVPLRARVETKFGEVAVELVGYDD